MYSRYCYLTKTYGRVITRKDLIREHALLESISKSKGIHELKEAIQKLLSFYQELKARDNTNGGQTCRTQNS